MKSQKGITLVAVTVYVIVIALVIGVIATVTSFFYSNTKYIDESGQDAAQFDTFNMFFLEDVKKEGNKIVGLESADGSDTVTTDTIGFSDGTAYTISGDGIYRNKVKICSNFKGSKFKCKKVSRGKVEVSILLEFGDTFSKTVTYLANGKIAGTSSDLTIGSEVRYNPSGSYLWEAEYCSSLQGATDTLLESGEGKSFNLSSWKVFDIDKTTGEVSLVPSKPTEDDVYLSSAQGYNNGVYLLNKACSNLYGNEAKGIKARSMNIEDMEGKMLPEKLEESKKEWKYGEQTSNAYVKFKMYPSIYEQENLSFIDGKQTGGTLGLSKQDKLIGRSDNGVTNGEGYKVAKDSIQPYQTTWFKDNVSLQTAFQGDYYNLIIPQGVSTNYWLASRSVDTLPTYCAFVVREVIQGTVSSQLLYDSGTTPVGHSSSLFPVVTLPESLIEWDSASGFYVNV